MNDRASASTQTIGSEKLDYFVTGMIRWVLNESATSEWHSEFSAKCQQVASDATKLGTAPSETQKKKHAMLKALPAASLYWLGIFTGIYWLIPGTALGLLGTYMITDSVYDIFKAGKEARFYQTYLYYLLRMENADGVLSNQEMTSLKAIIEFIPAPESQKKEWLQAIASPEGYKNLEPDLRISADDKIKILTGCWGLALCDGIDATERDLFARFGEEMGVDEQTLEKIQQDIENRLARHADMIWQIVKLSYQINPEIEKHVKEVAAMLPMLSMKPVESSLAEEKIASLFAESPIKPESNSETDTSAYQTLVSAYLLARRFAPVGEDMPEKYISNFTGLYQHLTAKDDAGTILSSINQAALML